MPASNSPRPVLLPQGWPEEDREREALTRVLLAAGADIERLLDEPTSSPEAFLRHAMRLPFLRHGRECPMIAFAPKTDDAELVLAFRSMLLGAVGSLRNTTCLVYLTAEIRAAFHHVAVHYGDLFDVRGGLLTWHVTDGIIGLVSRETWVVGLSTRLEELLNPCLESGIIAVDATPVSSGRSHPATTLPAPADGAEPINEGPYASVVKNSMPATPRIPSPSPFTSQSPYRPVSTMPPNPRLRKG